MNAKEAHELATRIRRQKELEETTAILAAVERAARAGETSVWFSALSLYAVGYWRNRGYILTPDPAGGQLDKTGWTISWAAPTL